MVNRFFKIARLAVHWGFLAVTLLFLLSGFGITEYQVVTHLTLGILGKAASIRIHNALAIPFSVLLVLHVVLSLVGRRWKKNGKPCRTAGSG